MALSLFGAGQGIWTTGGHAIYHAVALALHLRVRAGTDVDKLPFRSRTWWCLYGLAQLVGSVRNGGTRRYKGFSSVWVQEILLTGMEDEGSRSAYSS